MPEANVPPDSRVQTRRYAWKLDGAITNITAPNIAQQFDYANNSGKLTQAKEGEITTRLNNFPSGLLQDEKSVAANQPLSSNAHRYTMAGLIQQTRDSKNKRHTYLCDNCGRLIAARQGGQEALFSYDNYSRRSQIEMRGDSADLVTTILYDQFSREIKRTFSASNSTTVLTVAYTSDGRVSQRELTENGQRVTLHYDANGNLIRDEKGRTLIYDSKHRLYEVRSANNQLLCRYKYNAQDMLSGERKNGISTRL